MSSKMVVISLVVGVLFNAAPSTDLFYETGLESHSTNSTLLAQTTNNIGTTYYVSAVNGNDSNKGLTKDKPFKTIQKGVDAAKAGDTVYVMNGTYTQGKGSNRIVFFYHKDGTPEAPITLKAYPGHKPVIKSNSNTKWAILISGSSYIKIEGFTLIGTNDQISLKYAQQKKDDSSDTLVNGSGITIASTVVKGTKEIERRAHHIVIRNNNISKFSAGGIVTNLSDYITIEDNIISENAWYTSQGAQGISLLHNLNFDNNTTDYRNLIKGNVVYNNRSFIPWDGRAVITEGHGIMIDSSKQTKVGSVNIPYTGKTLISNNIVYNNGGSGIVALRSANVDIVNNTTYQNGQSPEYTKTAGEIDAIGSSKIKVVNNIMQAKPNGLVNNISGATQTIYSSNLVFNSTRYRGIGNRTLGSKP
ncbi:right-handed parallel beta-helix repeat-containing protein [Nostoc ellipsosporum NOK]|nr:right-handed parallel beta-helix repeat-containing protein [Nostoc ellipsosporum NOK]BAZ51282.1 hemolysin-type calcium-binding region [Nostoc sp. NIES-4103]